VKIGQSASQAKKMRESAMAAMSGRPLRDLGGRGAEDVRTQLVTADLPAALFVEPSRESTVQAGFRAEGFSEIPNGGAAALGVGCLLRRGESREVRSKGIHDRRLPFGNSKSIPFGTLPMGNGHYPHER
jgi:hypothetical protein